MGVREKLVELIDDFIHNVDLNHWYSEELDEKLADDLIANGVTVQGEIDVNTYQLMRECERLKEQNKSLANAVNVLEEINSDLYKKLNGVTVQEWISVKDRLPDKWMEWVNDEHMEPREFIVFIEDAEIPTVLCFDGDRFCDREHTEFYDVTHWMPLPDAPKGE